MTLTITLGHLVALGIGATVGTLLMAVLSAVRVQDARTDAKIARSWGESYKLRLDTEHAWHLEAAGFNSEIRVHLKKGASDARALAGLRQAVIDQQRDEIRTLNQLVTGAGEKLAGLNGELAEWAGLGRRLQSWLAGSELKAGEVWEHRGRLPAPQFEELEGLLSDLEVLQKGSTSQFTSIEETTSDEEAGREDDTREVAAVEA